MKQFILSTIFIFSALLSYGQRYGHFTSYIYNKNYYNPAYTGLFKGLKANLVYRNQWTDFTGSPVNILLNMDSPVGTKRIGVGFSMQRERIGAWNNFILAGNFAYKIQLDKGFLSVGVKTSLERMQVNYNSLRPDTEGDFTIEDQSRVQLQPNFGTGIFYYRNDFYAGYSLPRLLEDRENQFLYFDFPQLHHFFMLGKIFSLSKDLKLHTSSMIAMVPNIPFEFNITAALMIKEKVEFGLNYRRNDSIDGFLRLYVGDGVSFTGAYDVNVSPLAGWLGSTYELMFEYDFGKAKQETDEKLNPY